MDKKNILLEKCFEFALLIVEYCEILEEQKKYVVSNQLLKAGTSIGANANEAQSAESKADFIHKLKISDKEANETNYWLLICKHSKNYPNPDYLLEKLKDIKNILSKIIITSKRN